jgi:hypothetical protein
MHGVMHAEALLGPLLALWEVNLFNTLRSGQKTKWRFRNRGTGEVTANDPRLGPLPAEWKPIEKEDEMRLSWEVQHYRHRVTGETINSDPRMLPETLKARGVQIETICLV